MIHLIESLTKQFLKDLDSLLQEIEDISFEEVYDSGDECEMVCLSQIEKKFQTLSIKYEIEISKEIDLDVIGEKYKLPRNNKETDKNYRIRLWKHYSEKYYL